MNKVNNEYNRLIEPIKQRMVNSIWRIVQDPEDTKDVMQGVLEQIWRKWNLVCRHPNPTALILRICINGAYSHLRIKKRHICYGEESWDIQNTASNNPSPSECLEHREQLNKVLAALRSLPNRQAEAITMRVLEDLPYIEIAQAMGCKEATVRQLVSKARRTLNSMVQNNTF